MKVTIRIPDELYRRVKAQAALEGRTVREVTTELYDRWLDDPSAGAPQDSPEAWLQGWEGLGRRIAEDAQDPRTTREILLDDRR